MRLVFGLCGLLLVGCSGAPEAVGRDALRPVPPKARGAGEGISGAARVSEVIAVPPRRLSAAELEEELALTRPGRVVLRALRAHGGWEAWRRVRGFHYRVEPALAALGPNAKPEPGGEPEPEGAGTLAPVAYQGPREVFWSVGDGAPGSASLNERALLAGPFVFVARDLGAEYLGVEIEVATGEGFDKVKFFRRDSTDPFLWIAYFDHATHRFARLLYRVPEDGYRLVALGGLIPWGDSGLRLASRRRIWRLDGPYDRFDPERPDAERLVSAVDVDLATRSVVPASGTSE